VVHPFQRRNGAILSILVLCALPASAQQDAAPKAAVFTIQDLSPKAENKDYEQPITASVSAAIGVGGYSLIPPETWSGEIQKPGMSPRSLLSETVASSVARAVGADLAVTGFFIVEGDRIYISLQCWDVSDDVLAAGMQQTARFNIAFYSSLHDRVTQMLPQIRLKAQSAPAAAAGVPVKRQPTVSEMTFVSPDDGMEVILAGDNRLGTITDGKLVWQSGGLALGSRISVEKRKAGFHTSIETVRAAREIRLSPMENEKSRAVELDWTLGQLFGLGGALRLYTAPDGTFFSFSNYFYVQPPLTPAGSPVFHNDASLCAGTYLFFPPDSPVRFGVSTGVGWILTALTGPAATSYADPYWDVINWWVETKLLGPIIFLRQEWKFTTGEGPSLLGKGWMMVQGVPLMTLGVMFRW